MKYIKKNKYDVYNKICKIIDSCNTVKHIIVVPNIIQNFINIYGDYYLYNLLDYKVHIKLHIIH